MTMIFLTQVVVDEVCCESGLLVFPASVHACVGVGCVNRKDVGADAHQFCLPHEFSDGWGTRGQRSRQLLPRHPRLWPSVSGQFCFRPVLLQAGGDSSLHVLTHEFVAYLMCVCVWSHTGANADRCEMSWTYLRLGSKLFFSLLQRDLTIRL